MFGIQVRIADLTQRVINAVRRESPRALERMAKVVQETAQGQFIQSDQPSAAGSPPHTRSGALPDSILYAIDDDALIGPVASKVGQVGEAHEFGKEYKGQDYDIRAFMGPALEKSKDRLAIEWYGTI